MMALGLRTILLIAAVVIFVVSIFIGVEHQFDWLVIGLACTAGAFLAESLGWADRTVGSMTGRP
jgi:hypothetical protein